MAWVRDKLDALLEVVLLTPKQKGFQALPRRWVVELTPGWRNWYGRLNKDYGRLVKSSECLVHITSIQTLLRQMASPC